MSWGGGAWGAVPWGGSGGAAAGAWALSPTVVPNDGGYVVAVGVTGVSIPDGEYQVFLGPLGSTSDPRCYSGVSGSGQNIQITNNSFTCVTPILPTGGPFAFTIWRSGGSPQTSAALLTTTAHDFASRVLRYRNLLPRDWLTGYRTVDQEDLPQ